MTAFHAFSWFTAMYSYFKFWLLASMYFDWNSNQITAAEREPVCRVSAMPLGWLVTVVCGKRLSESLLTPSCCSKMNAVWVQDRSTVRLVNSRHCPELETESVCDGERKALTDYSWAEIQGQALWTFNSWNCYSHRISLRRYILRPRKYLDKYLWFIEGMYNEPWNEVRHWGGH